MMIHETTSDTARASSLLSSGRGDLADDSKRAGGARSDQTDQAGRVASDGNETERLDKGGLEKLLSEAEAELSNMGVALKFNLNEDSGNIQVEVRDSGNGKVIRKIPADEVVRLAESIKDMEGVFMNQPA